MKHLFHFLFFMVSSHIYAQRADSVAQISEVQIDAYRKPTTLLAATKAVSVVSSSLLSQNGPERLLESFNQIPGSRMEERSAGSYSISLRGSTLRSPFGVRNIKVYLDDFILSDASGNTYLNTISPGLIKKMEIYKGPESGDFGAQTGGTLLLKTENIENISADATIGSYGTFDQNVKLSQNLGQHLVEIFQNFYHSDSYREQSAIERKMFFLKDHFQYSEKGNLNAMLLFSDLNYETPGGLTLEQMLQNRKQARQATATLPSAIEQNAGIRNKMVLGGLSHAIDFGDGFSHFALFQGSYIDFQNPFITNFEKRFEHNFAARSHLNFERQWGLWFAQWRLGWEGAKQGVNIRNFDNNAGLQGEAQNFDRLENFSHFLFISQKINWGDRWFTDLSLSLNNTHYDWEKIYPETANGQIRLKAQWLPNFGIAYHLGKNWWLRGKIGKGNSAPTIEEVRASDQIINLNLVPEYGWNKEIGLRKSFGDVLFLEANFFDFRLKKAIVRQQNENGQEFFINRGGTVQKGLELLIESRYFNLDNKILNAFRFRFSGHRFHFKFDGDEENDLTGNDLTGVPATTFNSLLNFRFFRKLEVGISHFYASKIPLNDANSVWSTSSFVGNLRFSYPFLVDETSLVLNFHLQNIYDTDYVLGFDTNAFGGRYYNPAAGRTFYLGMQVVF